MAQAKVDFKIVLLGYFSTGKTSLVQRYLNGTFSQDVTATVGAAFGAKKVRLSNNDTIVLGIWDTAGSERYQSMAKIYYRSAAAAIICYDTTLQESFATVRFWCDELRSNLVDARIYIVATKCDLQPVVHRQQGEALAAEVHGTFVETSAKTGYNVDELFEMIAADLHTAQQQASAVAASSANVDDLTVSLTHNNEKQRRGGCCG